MRKFTLFASAALTAFIITVLAGVIYNYNDILRGGSSLANPATVTAQGASSVEPAPTLPPTSIAQVSPQTAAALAAAYLKRIDLYSVEVVDLDGRNVFKVTFVSGDIVYVSLAGEVLSSVAPVTVAAAPAASAPVGTVSPGQAAGKRHGGGGEGEGGE